MTQKNVTQILDENTYLSSILVILTSSGGVKNGSGDERDFGDRGPCGEPGIEIWMLSSLSRVLTCEENELRLSLPLP